MTCDPCAGHACDGCVTCRSGVCCLTASIADQPTVSVADDIALLREAIAEDASASSLSEFIRAETATRPVELTSHIQSDSIRVVLDRKPIRTPVQFIAGRDLPVEPDKPTETPALTEGADSDPLFLQTPNNERSSNVRIPRRPR
jgi:hypothetical protein